VQDARPLRRRPDARDAAVLLVDFPPDEPALSRPVTICVIVGGLTCSAAARSPSVSGPAKTTTERAESLAALVPDASSCFRRPRRRWMAAE